MMRRDWPALLKDYEKQLKQDYTLTQIAYAKSKDINETLLSNRFSELRKQRREHFRERTLDKLIESAPEIVDELIKEAKDTAADPTLKQKARFGLLDRAGFSPQAVAVNVNTAIQMNVVVPVLFASAHTEDVAKMLKPRKVVDVDAQAE